MVLTSAQFSHVVWRWPLWISCSFCCKYKMPYPLRRIERWLSYAFLYGVIDLKNLSHSTSELRNKLWKHKGIWLNLGLTFMCIFIKPSTTALSSKGNFPASFSVHWAPLLHSQKWSQFLCKFWKPLVFSKCLLSPSLVYIVFRMWSQWNL